MTSYDSYDPYDPIKTVDMALQAVMESTPEQVTRESLYFRAFQKFRGGWSAILGTELYDGYIYDVTYDAHSKDIMVFVNKRVGTRIIRGD